MQVEVCLTPELIHQHDLKGKLVVVVDIFRATSCMVTGMSYPIRAIYPVETVEECTALGNQGMVMAGERGGKKIEHFDIGNSPFEYMQGKWKDRDIAVTTTNGTATIKKSEAAHEILIGAFLNLAATVNYIKKQKSDVLIHCAAWKGTPNLEDTLYAGALIHELDNVRTMGDSAQLALSLYLQHKSDLLGAAKKSGHAARLARFGITRDISFCIKKDVYDVVVAYLGGRLVRILP
jgi:2-phosphosulfolactate phosphatase